MGLCLLGSWSIAAGLRDLYIKNLAGRIAASEPGAVDPRLVLAFELFRDRAEPRLAESVALSDVARRRRAVEFLRGRGSLGAEAIDRLAALAFDPAAERPIRISALAVLLEPANHTRAADRIVAQLRAGAGGRDDAAESARRWVPVCIGPEAVPALARLLADGPPPSRGVAARVLGMIGPPSAPSLPLLVAALDDPVLRGDAIVAIGAIGPPAAEFLARLDPLPASAADAEVLCAAVGRLGPDGAKAAGLLARLLEFRELWAEHPDVRLVAVAALGRIGEPGVGGLTAALRNEFDLVRLEAARALARLPGHLVPVAELVEALRREPMQFLGGRSIGEEYTWTIFSGLEAAGERGVPQWADLLASEDGKVRVRAFATLAKLGPRATGAAERIVERIECDLDRPADLEPALAALERIGPAAAPLVDRLVPLLDGATLPSPSDRAQLAKTIARLGVKDERALYWVLREAALSGPWELAAIRLDPALTQDGGVEDIIDENGDFIPKRLFSRLVRHLEGYSEDNMFAVVHHDDPLAWSSALALAAFGSRAVDPLLKALDDRRPEVRKSAVRSLGTIGRPAGLAADRLADRLGREPDPAVRLAGIAALAAIGEPSDRVLDRLVSFLSGGSPSEADDPARDAAAAALIALGEPASDRVADALSRGNLGAKGDDAAIRVLDGIRAPRPAVVSTLAVLLHPTRWRPRMDPLHLIWTLSRIGGPVAASALIGVADELDADDEARSAAGEALAAIADPSGPVVPVLLEGLKGPTPPIRIAAARALGRVTRPEPPVVTALVDLVLDDRQPDELRLTAAESLARVGRPPEPVAEALARTSAKGGGPAPAREAGPVPIRWPPSSSRPSIAPCGMNATRSAAWRRDCWAASPGGPTSPRRSPACSTHS